MAESNDKTEVPIVQEEFANFLRKYKVSKGGEMCDTIAENIGETGGANVFEDPEVLAKGLGTWSEYIGAPLRKQILQHWFAKKHIEVSTEALEAAGVTVKTEATTKRKMEAAKKVVEGTVWTVEVDDKGMPKIRMIKEAGEPGTTLAEATTAAKQIAKEFGDEESVVVYNESLGKHMPNFKSDFVKNNLGVAWAAARQMDQAVAAGESIDPMDTFLEQMAKMESMRELVGAGRKEPEAKGSVAELISGVRELKAMASEGKGLPEWMTDPFKFQEAIQSLVPKGDSEALKEIRDQLSKVRDDLHQAELKRKDEQITDLTTAVQSYRSDVGKLRDEIEKNRQITGRSAYDLIGNLIEKVPDKQDIRQMVTEAVGKGPRLLTRGAAERGKTLEAAATSIEAAAEVKAFADDWFRLG